MTERTRPNRRKYFNGPGHIIVIIIEGSRRKKEEKDK
jgi:hypothetical protein